VSPPVLILVLIAAVLHATWNAVAKHARPASTTAFVWLCCTVTTALFLPVVAILVLIAPPPGSRIDGPILAFTLGSAVLQALYFVLLQRGYRAGDLSLVYPLARGTGPLLASLTAVVFLGERPGPLGIAGIAAITGGIFVATGVSLHGPRTRASLGYGLATGATIAAYTIWDKHVVTALAFSPIVYEVARAVAQTAIMTPFVATGSARAALGQTWRTCRLQIVTVAVLSPVAYVLVLFALARAPVTVVAPAREISIVLGAFLGTRLFGEGHARRRIAAAVLMVAGIVALARA
jgi:drug/metabolite transporter (DMT)-like permease